MPSVRMRVNERFERSTLAVDLVKRRLDEAARYGVEVLSLTGGEPLLELDRLVELIRHAGRVGIKYIRTGTNGFVFCGNGNPLSADRTTLLAETLAGTPLRNFWISIDSAVPEVHEQMRGFPGVIAGIEKALPIFHRFGLYPSANLGVNRRLGGAANRQAEDRPGRGDQGSRDAFYDGYRTAFRKFYRFVIDMGFTIVNTCYPMSVAAGAEGLNPVYRATSEEDIVCYNPVEKATVFRALADTIPEFRGEVRVFSPLSSLVALARQYELAAESPYACRGGVDYFFVTARMERSIRAVIAAEK